MGRCFADGLVVTEVGYNALAVRHGRAIPKTKELTLKQRPADTNMLFLGWETLTDALPPL